MTQNNMRKEPSFGTPFNSVESNADNVAETVKSEATKPYVSLRSTQSPGHTFTPIMKRPESEVEETAQAIKAAANSAKEFAFTPASEVVENVAQEVNETASNFNFEPEKVEVEKFAFEKVEEKIEETVAAAQPEVKAEGFTTERIIPNAAAAAGTVAAATVAAAGVTSEKVKAKMPPKTRRLLLVGLLALALVVIFFLLKPSTPETVEELQSQQGGNLPIEFRPVDEAEAKRAEEQARAEQEAAKQQQEAQAAAEQQAQQTVQPATQTVSTQTEQPVTQQPAVVPAAPKVVEKVVESKPVEHKPVVAQPVIKPKTQGSVVYQPETAQKEQPKAQPKVERLTSQPQPAKVIAKPVEKAVEKTVVKAEPATTSSAVASTKTMTVPKGVSLMQVFRDNNLNISDVNAMSKVNSVVSNLKVGERVTVRLDNNNRVVEMSIGSGGKFTRQANGSYTFK